MLGSIMASAVLRSTTVWRLLAQRFDRAVEGQTVALSVSELHYLHCDAHHHIIILTTAGGTREGGCG